MTTFPFHATVPSDCTLTLPPEFSGKTVELWLTEDEEKLLRIKQSNYNFWHPKPLEERLKDVKPIRDIRDLYPDEPIWDSDEEFFAFIEAIGENPDEYKRNME